MGRDGDPLPLAGKDPLYAKRCTNIEVWLRLTR